jgi:hypothetical protein
MRPYGDVNIYNAQFCQLEGVFNGGFKNRQRLNFAGGHHGRESATLCKKGYQVKTANNAYAGLDFFEESPCVLLSWIIVDIKMYRIDGSTVGLTPRSCE